MTFNQAAIKSLISNVKSGAQQMGIFQQVLSHEPKSAPGNGVTMAFWVTSIKPSTHFSGLDETAGIVEFNQRIYVNMLNKPEDAIEANLMTAVSALINEYSKEFSFGGTVINVDLLGMESSGLTAMTGYVTIGNTSYRVANLTVPVIIDSMWTQVA